jgi:L-aspartate semialdehyde sulfurtransferase ferredoxin
MTALNQSIQTNTRLTSTSNTRLSDTTQIRLQLHIPSFYYQEPIISRLISDYGLLVNITGARLGATHHQGRFDLELRGTPQQLHKGLNYLQSLNIKIVGKSNAEGDSWHY